jgi:hypothetical protein
VNTDSRRATALALLAVAAGLGTAPSGAVDGAATASEPSRDALDLRAVDAEVNEVLLGRGAVERALGTLLPSQ